MLRNKFVSDGKPFGETDQARLTALEERVTAIRIVELAARPIDGSFDYDHFRSIHRHVFQDVYEWAGEERTAPTDRFMTKLGHSYYPAGPTMTAAAEAQFAKIAERDFLRGMPHTEFVRELAERWGELNVVHSFREGNTRTQVVFFSQLCEHAGYPLHAGQLAMGEPLRDAFVEARFHSQDTGRNDLLAAVLAQVVPDRSGSGGTTSSGRDGDVASIARVGSASALGATARPPTPRPGPHRPLDDQACGLER